MGFKLLEKQKKNFISLSNAPIFIFKQCRPGKAYRWRGAPAPCVCWYMYLQTSSQANIVSRPHTLQMSVWYDFHWHHFLRNRCMKRSVVSMQKTVSLWCDLYQMHHVRTCGLATGDSVLVFIVDENLFCNIPSILIQSSASNSPRTVHSSLRLPCLWEEPKFVAGHLNPECDFVLKMSHWRYAVAIQNLRNWHKILFYH